MLKSVLGVVENARENTCFVLFCVVSLPSVEFTIHMGRQDTLRRQLNHKNIGLGTRSLDTWFLFPAQPLVSYVILEKSTHLSRPQLPYRKKQRGHACLSEHRDKSRETGNIGFLMEWDKKGLGRR